MPENIVHVNRESACVVMIPKSGAQRGETVSRQPAYQGLSPPALLATAGAIFPPAGPLLGMTYIPCPESESGLFVQRVRRGDGG
jgi:hypothetical protein